MKLIPKLNFIKKSIRDLQKSLPANKELLHKHKRSKSVTKQQIVPNLRTTPFSKNADIPTEKHPSPAPN